MCVVHTRSENEQFRQALGQFFFSSEDWGLNSKLWLKVKLHFLQITVRKRLYGRKSLEHLKKNDSVFSTSEQWSPTVFVSCTLWLCNTYSVHTLPRTCWWFINTELCVLFKLNTKYKIYPIMSRKRTVFMCVFQNMCCFFNEDIWNTCEDHADVFLGICWSRSFSLGLMTEEKSRLSHTLSILQVCQTWMGMRMNEKLSNERNTPEVSLVRTKTEVWFLIFCQKLELFGVTGLLRIVLSYSTFTSIWVLL